MCLGGGLEKSSSLGQDSDFKNQSWWAAWWGTMFVLIIGKGDISCYFVHWQKSSFILYVLFRTLKESPPALLISSLVSSCFSSCLASSSSFLLSVQLRRGSWLGSLVQTPGKNTSDWSFVRWISQISDYKTWAAESQSQKWVVITSTSFHWGGNATLSLLNGVRVNRGYVQNVQRSRRQRSAPVHKHFVLCSLTLCKQTQTMTQCAGILTQTSWGRYIIQLRLRCHCWFMFLWNAMCGDASASLVSRPFVFFQVQNLTLAFQAAESVGIKPSLVSWCAADHTRSLCHSRGASLVQQLDTVMRRNLNVPWYAHLHFQCFLTLIWLKIQSELHRNEESPSFVWWGDFFCVP